MNAAEKHLVDQLQHNVQLLTNRVVELEKQLNELKEKATCQSN